MKKSVTKRIRFTKNGKIIRWGMATDHFRTRKTTKNLKRKSKTLGIDYPIKKIINY